MEAQDYEQDEEGRMATSNLKRSRSMLDKIEDAVNPDGTIPAWVQQKLATVFNDLSDVYGFVVSEEHQGSNPQQLESLKRFIKLVVK